MNRMNNHALTPEIFYGLPTDDWEFFRQEIEASVILNNLEEEPHKLALLKMRLGGSARNMFLQLAGVNIETINAALNALGERYLNQNRRDLIRLKFYKRKLNSEKETVEDFLAELQKMARAIYPENERAVRVREAFIDGLPSRLKRKALNEQPGVDVDQLCTRAARSLVIDQMVDRNDAVGAFNAVQGPERDDCSYIYKILGEIHDNQRKMSDKQDKIEGEVNVMARSNQGNSRGQSQPRGNFSQRPVWNGAPATQQLNWNRYGQNHYGQQGNFGQYNNWQNNGQQAANFGNQNNAGQNFRGTGRGMPAGQGRNFCYNCGKFGHFKRDCTSRPAAERGQQIPFPQQPKN